MFLSTSRDRKGQEIGSVPVSIVAKECERTNMIFLSVCYNLFSISPRSLSPAFSWSSILYLVSVSLPGFSAIIFCSYLDISPLPFHKIKRKSLEDRGKTKKRV
jgi:hypothetical protein